MAEKEAKSFKFKTLKVLQENTSQDGSRVTQLRIGLWIVNEKPTSIVIEKRDAYQNQNGEERSGKAKGFTWSDVKYMVDHLGEIEPLLKGQNPSAPATASAYRKPAQPAQDEFPE